MVEKRDGNYWRFLHGVGIVSVPLLFITVHSRNVLLLIALSDLAVPFSYVDVCVCARACVCAIA